MITSGYDEILKCSVLFMVDLNLLCVTDLKLKFLRDGSNMNPWRTMTWNWKTQSPLRSQVMKHFPKCCRSIMNYSKYHFTYQDYLHCLQSCNLMKTASLRTLLHLPKGASWSNFGGKWVHIAWVLPPKISIVPYTRALLPCTI